MLKKKKTRKILIIANLDIGLYKFRKVLIQRLLDEGNDVFISLPQGTLIKNLENMGCQFIETPVDRRGINPITDLGLFLRYLKIIRNVKPDLIVTYTIKPNIYGGLASRILKVPYAANITGLGTAFQKEGFVKKLVIFLYKLSGRNAKVIFFENAQNQKVFLENGIIRENQSCLLKGAGIDLNEYPLTAYPRQSETIHFLFIGRIMKEKGIHELLEAAKSIKKEFPEIIFDIVGPMEDNYKNRIDTLVQDGIIRYHGYQEDVRPFLEQCHCFVLPSYHEGMANTLLEAGAMGRPLITSRIHGCMEAVEEGKNGYLAKAEDENELEDRIRMFLRLPYEEKKKMGQASREWMETEFDKEKVVEKTVEELAD